MKIQCLSHSRKVNNNINEMKNMENEEKNEQSTEYNVPLNKTFKKNFKWQEKIFNPKYFLIFIYIVKLLNIIV